jgi:lysozyme
MYPPPGYKESDSVDYFFKAEHIRGEKVIDSEDLTLPMETKSVILQKGDYDENGAAAYNKDQSGDNFKPNNVVKKLQGDLITINFLPKGSDDGFFGDQTDKAVKEFQDYAIKLVRMKRSVGKTENTDKGLDQQSPDGIVGEKTRDELDKWLSNNWIKPIPTLRHGEYDDTGVDNGKGKRGTDDHHQGTPVVEAQQNLQKVGVYSDGAVDGWFYDKMLCSVKDFQSAAADATFVVNGNLTQFDQKLTGYQKGEMCPATQDYLKMVVDKGGKVPEKLKANSTSENGIQFIMQHEGFKEMPYNDSVGNATIGYGTLLHLGVVTDDDRKKYSQGISKDDAKKLLVAKVSEFEPKLNAAVKVDLNQNQFDALMDWTYNLGPGKLDEKNCTWLRNLNQGNYDKVPQGLLMWNKATKDGVLVELPGLTTRRQDEGNLFNKK